MIHYGLQYKRLLEIINDKLVNAKLEAEDARREHEEALKKECEASNRSHDAHLTFSLISKEFEEILKMKSFDAVEKYKAAQGKYPI